MEERECFVELAKLSQQAFEERRRYEWRLVFAIWVALGLIAHVAVKEKVSGLFSTYGVVLYCFAVLVCFTAYLNAVRRAHAIDKGWKHYYMHRAEGAEEEQPEPMSLHRFEWILPQVGLMVLVLILFGLVVLSVAERGTHAC